MSVRRLGWRICYELLAARVPTPDWAFMNYGYAATDPEAEALALDPGDEPDRLCIQLYEHAVAGADLRGLDVVEVGSGRGGGASYLARYRRPRTMTGVDFSARAVRFSRRHRFGPGLSFVPGDAQALPFPDASVDVVVNVESSHCYDSVPDFLAEVRRVLRPGGRLHLADFRRRESVGELRAQLAGSGLRVEHEADITAQVLAALERDDARKQALIERLIPRPARRPFRRFAGMRGTTMFTGFSTGAVQYRSARLVNDLS